MTRKLVPSPPRALWAAALFLGAAAAQAAGGYTVTKSQEALVAPGMSATAVQQALGRPEANVKFRNEPGPTYTYRISGVGQTLFDVDFGADGKVASVRERMDENRG
jgi:outer membrane protein assembly factor BamE (lipoprotein component of BamABCDE complex)